MEEYGEIWRNIKKYGRLWRNMEEYGGRPHLALNEGE